MHSRTFLTASILVILFSSLGCKKNNTDPSPSNTKITIKSTTDVSDSYIADSYPSNNYGTNSKIFCLAWTYSSVPSNTQYEIKFDYSRIPQGKVIKSAKLSFYADTTNIYTGSPSPAIGHYGTNLNWTIRRITSDWTENGVTYSTKPTVTDVNKVQLGSPATGTSSYIDIDVTNLVKDQMSTSNYGFDVTFDDYNPYKRLAFYSSDSPYTNSVPKLVITY